MRSKEQSYYLFSRGVTSPHCRCRLGQNIDLSPHCALHNDAFYGTVVLFVFTWRNVERSEAVNCCVISKRVGVMVQAGRLVGR